MNPFCQQSSYLEGWDGLRCSSLIAMEPCAGVFLGPCLRMSPLLVIQLVFTE